jgi:uncharacterized protein
MSIPPSDPNPNPPPPEPAAIPPLSGEPPPTAPAGGLAGFMARTPSPQIPSTKDERLWATLIHLSGILGCVTTVVHVPGGNLLLPLILWLIKRDGSAFINDQGKEAVNFQITATIALIIGIVLIFMCIGVIILPLVGLYILVISIYAAIKANEGVAFRHPLTLRLIK